MTIVPFTRRYISPLVEELLVLPDTDQYDRLVAPSFPHALVPVLVVSLCRQQDDQEVEKGLDVLGRWIAMLCLAGVPLSPVEAAVRSLCRGGRQVNPPNEIKKQKCFFYHSEDFLSCRPVWWTRSGRAWPARWWP